MKKTKQTLTKFLLLCILTFSVFEANAQAPTITKSIGYPIGANISCYGIAYGATKYAAITSNGDVYTSADGDNWSKSASLGESLYQITFANSLFVVCGANGYIATSTDGVTWTQRTTGSTSTLTDVQYLQNVFYAVGQNSTILSSSNGTTWTAVSVNIGTSTDWFNQITYGGGKYIIMANSSTGQGPLTYQSTTGASNSWSTVGGFGIFGNTYLNKIAYLNSQFILLTSSSDIFTSSNGASWTNIRSSMTVNNPNSTTATVGNNNYFNSVYYNAGTYYWVGYSNYNEGAYGAIFTSTNLTTLTLQANPVNIVANKSYYLNGKHYIAGNEGFATSSNGTTYAFPYGSYNSLAYNGSTYVGVGAISALSGGIFTSSTFDSNTWTNKTPEGQRPLYGVVHDGNKFVAVGDKTVISSTDGNTWTSIATPSELYTCLAYGASKYVIGGYASDYSAYFLKYSSDGITWTTANSDNFSYFKVRQVNGVFFALGLNNDYPASSGVIMSSSDGITWTNVTPTGLAFNVYTFNDVTWDGTKYHFIGADDAYNFFTISTATPSTTSSYANKGTINNVPDGVYLGSSWGEGFISYNNGKYVGAVVDTSNNKAYLIYSTDGTSWTSIATNDKSIVYDAIKDGNAFRIVGTGDEKISLLFAAPNTAPTFSNATTSLSVCQSAAATSINSLLQITDTDASQTETFSVTSAPSHGSITTGTTVGSGTNVSPTGWIYTPTNGYSGNDTFTIQVSDGTATASKTITVTVSLTLAPTASAQSFCTGATVANLVASPGVAARLAPPASYKWYTASTGGSALATSTALITGTYYVSHTLITCESERTSVSVTVNTTPAPSASAQTFCSGATVADLAATGTSLKWYSANSGGSVLAASTALSSGTYYVSQTLNSCESTRTSVVVTVNTTPLAPTASAQSFCTGATVSNLVASPGVARLAPPALYKWYTASTGGSPLSTSTALITGTYYVSYTQFTCESSRTSVAVTINTTPAPSASAQTFCSGATVADLAATGTSLKWYSANSGGSALATSTALSSGTYYVSQTLNSCEGTRTSVVVTIDAPAVAGTISGETTVSSVTNSTVLTLIGNTGNIQWQSSNTIDGNYSNIDGATTNSYTATNLTSTTYYRVVVTNGVCSPEISSPATITVSLINANDSKIIDSQCGATLSAINTLIRANAITGASHYKFKVVNGATTEIIEPTSGRWFRLTSLPGGTFYNTSYTISVAVKRNNVWGEYGDACAVTTPAFPATKVLNSQCGTTLASINTLISANVVNAATGYRFKVVNGASTQTIEAVSGSRWFRLTSLSDGTFYNTAYTVSVATRYNGVWSEYGEECTVTTPVAPATKVRDSQCGITLASLNTTILANAVSNTTGYRFKVVNQTTEETIDAMSGSRWFRLTSLSGGATYNTTYTVSVATRYNGVWSEYGEACLITTPAAPLTKLQDRQCGITLNSGNTDLLYANPVSVAQKYRFEVSLGADVYTYDTASSSVRSFRMTEVPGLTLVNGTTYAVKVAIMANDEWQPYGESCTITTFGDAPNFVKSMNVDTTNFNVLTYPNPFTENFNLNLTSLSVEKVTVMVYDMTGKLLEKKEVAPSELSELQVGTNFASGIYNVIVSQGENTKSIRVIKK